MWKELFMNTMQRLSQLHFATSLGQRLQIPPKSTCDWAKVKTVPWAAHNYFLACLYLSWILCDLPYSVIEKLSQCRIFLCLLSLLIYALLLKELVQLFWSGPEKLYVAAIDEEDHLQGKETAVHQPLGLSIINSVCERKRKNERVFLWKY